MDSSLVADCSRMLESEALGTSGAPATPKPPALGIHSPPNEALNPSPSHLSDRWLKDNKPEPPAQQGLSREAFLSASACDSGLAPEAAQVGGLSSKFAVVSEDPACGVAGESSSPEAVVETRAFEKTAGGEAVGDSPSTDSLDLSLGAAAPSAAGPSLKLSLDSVAHAISSDPSVIPASPGEKEKDSASAEEAAASAAAALAVRPSVLVAPTVSECLSTPSAASTTASSVEDARNFDLISGAPGASPAAGASAAGAGLAAASGGGDALAATRLALTEIVQGLRVACAGGALGSPEKDSPLAASFAFHRQNIAAARRIADLEPYLVVFHPSNMASTTALTPERCVGLMEKLDALCAAASASPSEERPETPSLKEELQASASGGEALVGKVSLRPSRGSSPLVGATGNASDSRVATAAAGGELSPFEGFEAQQLFACRMLEALSHFHPLLGLPPLAPSPLYAFHERSILSAKTPAQLFVYTRVVFMKLVLELLHRNPALLLSAAAAESLSFRLPKPLALAKALPQTAIDEAVAALQLLYDAAEKLPEASPAATAAALGAPPSSSLADCSSWLGGSEGKDSSAASRASPAAGLGDAAAGASVSPSRPASAASASLLCSPGTSSVCAAPPSSELEAAAALGLDLLSRYNSAVNAQTAATGEGAAAGAAVAARAKTDKGTAATPPGSATRNFGGGDFLGVSSESGEGGDCQVASVLRALAAGSGEGFAESRDAAAGGGRLAGGSGCLRAGETPGASPVCPPPSEGFATTILELLSQQRRLAAAAAVPPSQHQQPTALLAAEEETSLTQPAKKGVSEASSCCAAGLNSPASVLLSAGLSPVAEGPAAAPTAASAGASDLGLEALSAAAGAPAPSAGYPNVSFDATHNRWIAFWKMHGRNHSKSFSCTKYGGREAARAHAVGFRRTLDSTLSSLPAAAATASSLSARAAAAVGSAEGGSGQTALEEGILASPLPASGGGAVSAAAASLLSSADWRTLLSRLDPLAAQEAVASALRAGLLVPPTCGSPAEDAFLSLTSPAALDAASLSAAAARSSAAALASAASLVSSAGAASAAAVEEGSCSRAVGGGRGGGPSSRRGKGRRHHVAHCGRGGGGLGWGDGAAGGGAGDALSSPFQTRGGAAAGRLRAGGGRGGGGRGGGAARLLGGGEDSAAAASRLSPQQGVDGPASGLPSSAPWKAAGAAAGDAAWGQRLRVVSGSITFDRSQNRFMAQWKTSDGCKHSKSFYIKNYRSVEEAQLNALRFKEGLLAERDTERNAAAAAPSAAAGGGALHSQTAASLHSGRSGRLPRAAAASAFAKAETAAASSWMSTTASQQPSTNTGILADAALRATAASSDFASAGGWPSRLGGGAPSCGSGAASNAFLRGGASASESRLLSFGSRGAAATSAAAAAARLTHEALECVLSRSVASCLEEDDELGAGGEDLAAASPLVGSLKAAVAAAAASGMENDENVLPPLPAAAALAEEVPSDVASSATLNSPAVEWNAPNDHWTAGEVCREGKKGAACSVLAEPQYKRLKSLLRDSQTAGGGSASSEEPIMPTLLQQSAGVSPLKPALSERAECCAAPRQTEASVAEALQQQQSAQVKTDSQRQQQPPWIRSGEV